MHVRMCVREQRSHKIPQKKALPVTDDTDIQSGLL